MKQPCLGKGGAREGEFRPVQLFKRLENFYLRWCDGEFIDALQDNYPQKKMSQLQGQGIKTGVRQVDVYAGLNVMILLLELNRYAQSRDDLKDKIAFYPCGRKDTESFDAFRLLYIISYSHSVGFGAFLETVGFFLSDGNFSGANLSLTFLAGADLTGADLSGANLNGADLSGVSLSFANLSGAELRGSFLCDRADLSGANLSGANLNGADLSGVYLSGANLSGAELRGSFFYDRADLIDADLSYTVLISADLSRADLIGASLIDADLTNANLENISWDEDTNWEGVRGVETAVNLPEALKQQLGL